MRGAENKKWKYLVTLVLWVLFETISFNVHYLDVQNSVYKQVTTYAAVNSILFS